MYVLMWAHFGLLVESGYAETLPLERDEETMLSISRKFYPEALHNMMHLFSNYTAVRWSSSQILQFPL